MEKTKKIFGIIIIVLLVAVLGTGVYFAGKYTNWFKDNLSSIYLEKDGKVLKDESNLILFSGSDNTFKITSLENIGFSDKNVYDVKVWTSNDKDFNYVVDGDTKRSRNLDVTNCFDITMTKTSLTISLPEEITVESIFEKYHEGSQVSFPLEISEINQTEKYFILQIVDVDKPSNVYLNFNFSIFQKATKIEMLENLVF